MKTSDPPPFQRSVPSREDPRTNSEFNRQYYPNADGHEPPLQGTERRDRVRADFAAAYYDINCHYAALLEFRQSPAAPSSAAQERQILQFIEQALRYRDALEDAYAPYGIVVEPIMEKGVVVDLKCSFGPTDFEKPISSELVTLAGAAPVPIPEDAHLEDFLKLMEIPPAETGF